MRRSIKRVVCIVLCFCLSGCSSIKLDVSEIHLKPPETTTVNVTTKDTPITYWLSDPAVATINESGVITPVGEGTATLTVMNSKGKSVTCAVIVDRVEPDSVRFEKDSFTLTPDEGVETEVTIKPDYTTYYELFYSSDNGAVATVDADGRIQAEGPGKAVITVTTENGKEARCNVAVLPYAERIEMESAVELEVEETITLNAILAPENCVEEELTWNSSDESVATVESGVITAVGEGTAQISCSTSITGCTATCEVTVKPAVLKIKASSVNTPFRLSSGTIANGAIVYEYQLSYEASVIASGGDGNYLYKFDCFQNDYITASTGWTTDDAASGSASGYGSSCFLRVSVQDGTGNIVSRDYDLLNN